MGRACQTGDLEQTVDIGASFQYFEKAADRGQVNAMLSLSKMYLEGQAVEFNAALAFKWCERSAASGLDHAEFALG
jgi:TPR repeat protein